MSMTFDIIIQIRECHYDTPNDYTILSSGLYGKDKN